MIILHNIYDKNSREFIDYIKNQNEPHVVIDWYNGGREHYEKCAGHKMCQTFPSVVIHVPAHKEKIPLTEVIVDIDEAHIHCCEPSTLEDIQNKLNEINEILEDSQLYGMPVEALTWDDLHSYDVDYSV